MKKTPQLENSLDGRLGEDLVSESKTLNGFVESGLYLALNPQSARKEPEYQGIGGGSEDNDTNGYNDMDHGIQRLL